jgi:CheY-like chemotaxis protein
MNADAKGQLSLFPAKRQRVLLVDDEVVLAQALYRLLEDRYEVVVATSGKDALRTLSADDAFDIVFCDLIMPDVSGMELFERVTAAKPELADRFVFTTGGRFLEPARRFLESVKNRVLEKPFCVRQIEAVCQALAS